MNIDNHNNDRNFIRRWIDSFRNDKNLYGELLNAHALSEFVSTDSEYNKPSTERFDKILERIRDDEKMMQINKSLIKRILRYAAAAAVLTAIVTSTVWYLGINSKTQSSLAENKIIVPMGQRAEIILADGTEVWLNAKSQLSYSTNYFPKNRVVELEGEAYFKVTSDQNQPFLVRNGNIVIKVTGTEFNVNAYPEENDLRIVLVEGSVELYNEMDVSEGPFKLEASQMASVSKTDNKINIHSNVDTELYTCWRNGQFKFNKMSFAEISRQLERNYGVKFDFKNDEIKEITYTGSFYSYESVSELLRIMSISTPFQYTINKDTIIID